MAGLAVHAKQKLYFSEEWPRASFVNERHLEGGKLGERISTMQIPPDLETKTSDIPMTAI